MTDDEYEYDAEANSIGCFVFGLRAGREKAIREGRFEPNPRKPDEVRWAQEGPVASPADLECARDG